MPTFRVVGADQKTGKEAKVRVEATSREDAMDKANRYGILVSECTQIADSLSTGVAGSSSASSRGTYESVAKTETHKAHLSEPASVSPKPLIDVFWDTIIADIRRSPRTTAEYISRVIKTLKKFCVKLREPAPKSLSSDTGRVTPPPLENYTPSVPKQCENCDKAFGKLEQPFQWQNAYVCFGCWQSLTNQTEARGMRVAPENADRPVTRQSKGSFLTRPIDGSAIQSFARAVLGLAVAVGFVIWAFSPSKNGGASDSAATALPTIRVTNLYSNSSDSSVTFSDWAIEGYTLKATMVWVGPNKISDLTYTVRRGGVVLTRGTLYVPGDGMIKNEPTIVHIILMQKITSDMEVTVEVAD